MVFTPGGVWELWKDFRILQSTRVPVSFDQDFLQYMREASGTSRGKGRTGPGNHPLYQPESVAPLSLEGLAQTFYMSKNHLTAVFKRATGTTVARYILYKRMAIVRKELSMGCWQQRQRPERDLETTPVFSGLLQKCLDARPLDKTRRECLRWMGEVWFENA